MLLDLTVKKHIKLDVDSFKKIVIILSLAVPAMIENLLQTVVGFVDTLFMAKLGLVEVAAVGVTNAMLAVYIAVFMALGIGASALIARSVGAGDLERAKAVARQSTWISFIAGMFFGVVTMFFADPLLRIMGAAPDVLEAGIRYFRIVAVPSVFISQMVILGSILRAAGDTRTPMKVSLWVNIIHIGLGYVLIFGAPGLPGLGITGAAWATVIVRAAGATALFYSIRRSSLPFSLTEGMSFRNNKYTWPILKLTAPAAVERLMMRLGQVLYFGLIIHIGTQTYAAHMIAGNVEIFSYMPGYGLAVAATTLVGQSLGARQVEKAYSYGILTTGIAVILMSFFGVGLFFLAPWAASLFTKEQSVAGMVVTALRITAFAQPALAAGLVLAGALQGSGDTRSPMYSTGVGMWLIRVAGVYILGIQMDMGIAGVWLSIAIDLCVRAVYLFYKFRKIPDKVSSWEPT